ncbi:hypothetical protein O4J56_07065 [Nocardiopsis sp. RSe5-2]|uniref:Uncharacterized protein n=1 Tax=Nocardiopsis endophytica TaxID=3018445 RepID=A0ABT4U139_9ACTN|nr:hypothetical protein [Nocardiopsis endophytica]MDA2810396.1 hypothetical protein [Nocardiopsis endophytica]
MRRASRKAHVPPDYDAFLRVHQTHCNHWRLTYTEGASTPYRATNRVEPDIELAASTLEALDHALAMFEPPAYDRPYIDLIHMR